MSVLLEGFALFLLLNLGAGMVRVWRGPTPADRMSAALLFGSTTVAVLLVLAEATGQPALADVALLFVMLAAILSVAFVGLARTRARAASTPAQAPAGSADGKPSDESG